MEETCRDCEDTGLFYQIEDTPCHCQEEEKRWTSCLTLLVCSYTLKGGHYEHEHTIRFY